ncbi:MAG: peptidylprolyl isomerase [Clostridia bacterium]|nr:peptidylprolyl isomerase [Clostridia bacterium]
MGNSSKKFEKELKKVSPKNGAADSSHALNVVLIALAVFLCVAIIAATTVLIVTSVNEKNAAPDELVAFKSDHYEVDNGMLTYYYASNFYQFYQSNYYAMVYYYSFDPSKSLSSQYYDQENGTTWHQYFLESAANTAMQNLYLAEDAYEAGVKLGDEDKKIIDDALSNLEAEGKENNMDLETYIHYLYGNINEESVRKAMELAQLANKQNQLLVESFGITTQDCEAYYTENKTLFDKVDFRSYDIQADVTDDMTDEQLQAAYAKAEATAKDIASAASEEEFIAKIYSYMLEKNAILDTPLDEETVMNNAKSTETVGNKYTDGGEMDTWLYDSSRKVGDTTVISSKEGTYTPYFITATSYRDDYNTVNVRHILVKSTSNDDEAKQAAAKETADELQAKWNESDKTIDAFEKLSEEYNEDSSSLYENVKKGDMVTEFNDWIFAQGRKSGDCEMVKTQYGYHLIYFVDNGDVAWESEAKDKISENKMTEKLTELSKKYDIDYDSSRITKIADYNAYQLKDNSSANTTKATADTSVDTKESSSTDSTATE